MRIIILLLAVVLMGSCTTYKYSYIKQNPGKKYSTFQIQKLNVSNSELLFLDRNVISNSMNNLFIMVMQNNGYVYSTDAANNMDVQINILVEDNDIINNKQSLAIYLGFYDKNSLLANFVINSRSKEILLDKELLVRELNDVLQQIKK
ncbi:MAG: hypothetical protein JXQ23_00405 [Clostridia bacterium]|nr:hypothetical protein [Clostridia bacterium]